MKDFLFVLVIGIGALLLGLGWGVAMVKNDCYQGNPIVIENVVYRCVMETEPK